MITQALLHCPGIGPARLARLRQAGVTSWADVLRQPDVIDRRCREAVVEECRRSLAAFESNDLAYLVERFAPKDKWRILAHYYESVTYFDIETAGLEYDAPITVIACWHRGKLHTFVENENLDDFLELLDDVTLLTSFNGASFDVPRVLDAFHLPQLPCPHLDLRWILYHHGVKGDLKSIAVRNRISPPQDIVGMDGEEAVLMWNIWQTTGVAAALDRLVRYCAADVLLLVLLTHRLVGSNQWTDDNIWSHLPEPAVAPTTRGREAPATPSSVQVGNSRSTFGAASPSKLRALRLRRPA